MGDETDNEIDPAVAEVQNMLEQLESYGELDSERLTFETTMVGGVHLDQIGEMLPDFSYEDDDPVRITIEPDRANPSDHHYRIEITHLSYVKQDGEWCLVEAEA